MAETGTAVTDHLRHLRLCQSLARHIERCELQVELLGGAQDEELEQGTLL